MTRKFQPAMPVLVLLVAVASRAQDLPGLAAGILEQSDLARKAVASNDKQAAADHINQALANARNIKEHSDPAAASIVVPVRTEIETTTTYTPVKRGKGEMTAKRMKRDTSVREVQGTVTHQALNVTAAASQLETAQAALERNDWAAADSALAAVHASVVREQERGDMPLLKTRQNLELARSRVLEDKYNDASAPLRAAAEGLAAFAAQSEGPLAERASSMRSQIEDYARTVRERPSDAVDRINGWLDPVNEWLNGKPR